MRSRGGRASVAALVRLLAPLGITAPAVRTAISRMVRQGWLRPERLPQGPGYAVTPKAVRRLDEAAARVYRAGAITWSGRWHLVVMEPVRERARRERIRAELAFLGYAPLSESTWIGPRPAPELDALLTGERVRADRFDARLEDDPRELVARAWDLPAIGAAYEKWLDQAVELVGSLPEEAAALCAAHTAGKAGRDGWHDAGDAGDAGADDADERGPRRDELESQVFAVRSRLVHGWRNFLFRDPGLPAELLPPGWPGDKARAYFEQEAARLLPAAAAFVDRCLAGE